MEQNELSGREAHHAVDPGDLRPVAGTSVQISAVGMGAAPLGGLFAEVPADVARAALDAAVLAGMTYIDVAPSYGLGLAERQVGEGLAGTPRDSFVLSTKVGRLIEDDEGPIAPDDPWVGIGGRRAVVDFSRDGVRRSVEESLLRLRLDRLDIIYIHDPDDHYSAAVDDAFPALAELKAQGVIGAIGVGMNQWQMLARFVRETDIDVVLCAGRYTLLDQSAGEVLLPLCLAEGVSVVIGGVFNSGALIDPFAEVVRYDYKPASADIIRRAQRQAQICSHYGVPLRAAALQFALRSAAVTSVLTGIRAPAEVRDNQAMARIPIPDDLWDELDDAMTTEGG